MKVEPASQQTLEHFHLTLQAAAVGVGVAIAPYAVVRDDLERGAKTIQLENDAEPV